MNVEQMALYSRVMGYLTAGIAWLVLIVLIRTRPFRLLSDSYWLVTAWVIHVGLFFTTVRVARDVLAMPIPPYLSNVWSSLLYLQALFSVLGYMWIWHRYR